MYGDTNLGATDEAAVMFLKSPMNKKLFDALKRHVFPEFALQYDHEKEGKKEDKKEIEEPPVNPESGNKKK